MLETGVLSALVWCVRLGSGFVKEIHIFVHEFGTDFIDVYIF